MKMSQLHRVPRVEIDTKESSAPTDYAPQHPVLDLHSTKMSQEDHLDTYTEVNPYKLEEMEDAEGLRSLVASKFKKRAIKKKAKAKAKAARKTAEAINKLAVGVGKLKEKAKQLIKKAVKKYEIDEDSLKEKMSDHLNKFGKELLDM